MKVQAKKVQYTVRGVPSEVDAALRQKAKRQKQSLNQVILAELARTTTARSQKGDFSDLSGQWTPDPEFDQILTGQRKIDSTKWK